MIKEGMQVTLTFFQRGVPISKGIEVQEDGTIIKNAATKNEIRKMMAFTGAVNPETGKFDKLLNIDWYIQNKKPFPKKYYWSKSKYIEPTYSIVKRSLHWSWEQINAMLNIPLMPEKIWKKLTDEQKLEAHVDKCRLPGEYDFEITYIGE